MFEGKRRARGRAVGSLSILIVPQEKWRTDPREPPSREGGCRAEETVGGAHQMGGHRAEDGSANETRNWPSQRVPDGVETPTLSTYAAKS